MLHRAGWQMSSFTEQRPSSMIGRLQSSHKNYTYKRFEEERGWPRSQSWRYSRKKLVTVIRGSFCIPRSSHNEPWWLCIWAPPHSVDMPVTTSDSLYSTCNQQAYLVMYMLWKMLCDGMTPFFIFQALETPCLTKRTKDPYFEKDGIIWLWKRVILILNGTMVLFAVTYQ